VWFVVSSSWFPSAAIRSRIDNHETHETQETEHTHDSARGNFVQKDAAAVEKIDQCVQKNWIAVEKMLAAKISGDQNLHPKNSDLE
jgi:hypothetical protein